MIVSMAAASQADLAIGPGESWTWDIGMMPLLEANPTVGFNPKSAARLEGDTIEPSEVERHGSKLNAPDNKVPSKRGNNWAHPFPFLRRLG